MSKVIKTRELGDVLVSPSFARTLTPGEWLVDYQRAQTPEGAERAAYVVGIHGRDEWMGETRVYVVLQDRTGYKPWITSYEINETVDRVVGSSTGGALAS
jgi:hypothetical protein